ncbi:hypothetical protein [Streptomyces jumonjinensis]|uniref:hypothetical protein n=1 Tax=Streptomyces jumonjinensis TaxID=1945 RepID=UPI0037BC37F1
MQIWERTRRDAKKLSRTAQIGDTYHVLMEVATNLAPYEDPYLIFSYTVKYMHPLLGVPMICGSLSVERLVLTRGPVYDTPPGGYRNVAEPGRQCEGPLPEDSAFGRPLTKAEIDDLTKRNRKTAYANQGRRRWL